MSWEITSYFSGAKTGRGSRGFVLWVLDRKSPPPKQSQSGEMGGKMPPSTSPRALNGSIRIQIPEVLLANCSGPKIARDP